MLPTLLFCCVISYIVGSLPFGLWIGLLWKRVDIRTLGSKNIGATNVLRVLGPGPGLTVFALDTLKGAAGVLLTRHLLPQSHIGLYLIVGLLAIVGHTFSVFLRFKGGKGVATTFGALLALHWLVALIALIGWVLTVAVTRYVSLASLIAGWSIPVGAYFVARPADRWWLVGLGVVVAVLVTVKHRANIHRLLTGTEAKIGQRVDATTPAPREAMEVKR